MWSLAFNRDDVQRTSDIVLNGRVAYAYQDLIPGVTPRQMGVHCLLEPGATSVRASSPLAHNYKHFAQAGFWSMRGQYEFNIGEEITASLVLHMNEEHYLTLMPHPCSEYSVINRDGETMRRDFEISNDTLRTLRARGKLREGKIYDMPLTYSIGDRLDEAGYNMVWYGGQMLSAYEIWKTAWQLPPKVTFAIVHINWYDEQPPPFPPYHYIARFAGSLAPAMRSTESVVLASTDVPPPPNMSPQNRWEIVFNGSLSWWFTTPGPGYDFVSVMAHEMGHSLGLGHLNGDANNLMYESYHDTRVLQPADKDAMTNKYG